MIFQLPLWVKILLANLDLNHQEFLRKMEPHGVARVSRLQYVYKIIRIYIYIYILEFQVLSLRFDFSSTAISVLAKPWLH